MTAALESAYEVVIGLEVHAQVTSKSKMFCRCSTDYTGHEPNTHVCPVCMGMPGVLPVINQRAVEATIMTGLALNCTIPERAKFDRKNYPYPDLVKGYQISEYDMPLCINGYLDIEVEGETRRIRVNRVHLEEDTARLSHRNDSTGDYSLLDLNRAGMPLMEIVTEPDARSPEEALAYLMKLRQILRYLGVSHANMDEGSFRCEPNLSLRKPGAPYGSKVELKNLASFRAALRGTQFEVVRQTKILNEGGHVVSETRGWREETQETASQRSKEQAHDYRYFPEPDLPPIAYPRERVEELRALLPELPDAKHQRFLTQYGLSEHEAITLVDSRGKANIFEELTEKGEFRQEIIAPTGLMGLANQILGKTPAKMAASFVLGDLSQLVNEFNLDWDQLATSEFVPNLLTYMNMLSGGEINRAAGKEVLREVMESNRDPKAIVEERGLGRIEDAGVVPAAVAKAIEANPKAVADYKAGKAEAVKFLLGQVMRETRGRANAAEVQTLLIQALDNA